MKQHGIERQTLAVAVIPILILALLLEGYFTYTRFADLDRALFERAKLIVHQLASSSEYPVFSGNQGSVAATSGYCFRATGRQFHHRAGCGFEISRRGGRQRVIPTSASSSRICRPGG